MSRRRARSPKPQGPAEAVAALLDPADRICWFPVKHHSPACAWHVRQLIEALRPDAVLVEGPDDASPLIPALVDPGTRAPVSILSTWVDRKNQHGLNGELTPTPDVPVRFRGWWPLVPYSPELVALQTGAKLGAELGFIDAPLPATLPFDQARQRQPAAVVSDRALAEGAYFEALRVRQRRRSFAELWEASFEVDGFALDTLAFMERVLTFAWCTRHLGGAEGLAEDGTLLREAHMRWHVDQVRARHAGWLVVVTGAFHAVALPSTRAKRSKIKADRDTTTVLCAHSYPALARLTEQNRSPAWGEAVWAAAERGEAHPHGPAAMGLLTEVMRAAREAGQAVSTADAVGAWAVARNLAALRANQAPTLYDLTDAVEMAYLKGEAASAGLALEPVARRVLVGDRVGSVAASAGQTPLISAYYAACKQHRIDVSGEHRIVRCDLGKQAGHRAKSAFLHVCDRLELPMFAAAERDPSWRGGGAHFRGPDPSTGTDLHLIGETWGIRWREEVDDRLIELSDRGTSLAEVAGSLLADELEASRADVEACTRLLLQTARMMQVERFEPTLRAVEDALRVDRRFLSLTGALGSFTLLLGLREGLTEAASERLLDTLRATWEAAALQLPGLAGLEAEGVRAHVLGLQDLVRLALGFEERAMDLRLLAERLEQLAADPGCDPGLRGAAVGVLYSLGHRREAQVAAELDRVLAGAGAQDAGRFLEGLFVAGKSALLGGRALLAAVDRVLGQLDWPAFRALLPDLRRAFTQFIPRELDALGAQVAAHIGLSAGPDPDRAVPEGLVALVQAADARATALLADWLPEPPPPRLG